MYASYIYIELRTKHSVVKLMFFKFTSNSNGRVLFGFEAGQANKINEYQYESFAVKSHLSAYQLNYMSQYRYFIYKQTQNT